MSTPLKITAQGSDGKMYWLAAQQPAERLKGACGGCAFDGALPSCRRLISSHACVGQKDCWWVWKEVAPAAFGCDAEARGYGVCEKHCGSNLCVNSQG